MKKLIFTLLLLSCLAAQAALTFVSREPFAGAGTLTTAAPGSNFTSVSGTLTKVRVGPRTSAIAAPGWSADIRTTGPVNYRGSINLTGAATTCGMWGTWVRIKQLPDSGGYMSVLQLLNRTNTNVIMDFTVNSSGLISTQPFNSNGVPVTFTSPAITPNTWVWLAVAWQTQTGSNFPYGIRCMSKTLTGALTTWGSADGLNALGTTFSSVNAGLQTGGTGPMVRIGCPSLYSMSSFADIAYPPDIIPPVEQSNNWYVNTASGNDANDGATAATAWKSAAKITAESQYSGILDSNATGPGNGDALTIDTSGGPLVIGTSTLAFATQGLKVQPASGQTYIMCQAEQILSNAAFTKTAGLSNTYQTTDTQSLIVAWENDKWMWHVKSSSFGAAASVSNPENNVVTNYSSTGAALDALPGSFYTDGSKLYIHPFGNTNPVTDGKIYTRSINRGNAASAVAFSAGNYRAIGFYVRKTTLVDQGDNDFGAYCFQEAVLHGSGFSDSIEGCYFAYGDKHCLGSTSGTTASSLLVLNTQCEQAHAYCSFGGQTPFVSYTGSTTADVTHIYRNCTCLARSGRIGSTAGNPIGTGGDIFLSHNNGTGTSFSSITLDNCNFASGSVSVGVSTNFTLTNGTKVGQVLTSCPNNTAQGVTFTEQLVTMQGSAANLTIQNSLIKPTFALKPAPPYFGLLVTGNVGIQGCTFDLAGITGDSNSYFEQGMIQRTGPLNLTFRNNAYVVPAGQNLPLLYNTGNSDTLTFDHNAYNLGAGTILARSSTGANLTFAQWQALGRDCTNSTLNANLLLQNDIPQSGSPLINAGAELGSMADVTGTLFAHRNTIGAYQNTGTYLAPQSISSLPSAQNITVNASPINLPATTSAGLTITYTVVSGPATVSGHTLTLTGTGVVVLKATQAGNGSNAALTQISNLSVALPATDTPTMPQWALIILGVVLALTAARSLRPKTIAS